MTYQDTSTLTVNGKRYERRGRPAKNSPMCCWTVKHEWVYLRPAAVEPRQ